MKYNFTFFITMCFMLGSCAQKENVSLIVKNAKVYTVDDQFSIVECFAVDGNTIVATGSNDDIEARYAAEQVLDAGGKPVYPGFIDGHCHFYGYACNQVQKVDLVGTSSFGEILKILKKHHQEHPGPWITGRGWDQNDWEVKEFPDNKELDKMFPETAVVLTRIDGHAVLANSRALMLAGFTGYRKIEGGEIVMKDGEMTGILIDRAADNMKLAIPALGREQLREGLLAAQGNCFAVGLTSVVDAGLGFSTILLVDTLQQEGKLKMRVNAMISPHEESLEYFMSKGIYKTDRLHVNAVKLYADGALGSRGALMLEPYSDDPGNRGLQMKSAEYYRGILVRAYSNNYQVNTHCIGDSANRLMLQLYGEVLQGQNDRRWRIEHAQVVNQADFALFGKYSVIPSIQSTHATSDMYWADERLGAERIKGAYAYKQLLGENGWLVNGTDFPVENINPLYTFYAAVARKDQAGWPENGFQTENALSRTEALRSITIWAAKGSFEEDEKGSIEPGKLADFVVLEQDIMEVPDAEIHGIKVLKTYIGGEVVYEK